MKPIDLDQQSPVKIDRWLVVDSEEFKKVDPDPWVTKQLLKKLFSVDAISLDTLGRVWSNPSKPGGTRVPLNFTVDGITYGYRLPNKAAN